MALLPYSNILFSYSFPLGFVNHFNPSILYVGKAFATRRVVSLLSDYFQQLLLVLAITMIIKIKCFVDHFNPSFLFLLEILL